MITEMNKKLLDQYNSLTWELRVRRPGFLQSHAIVVQAELQPLKLTSIVLKYNSMFWVKEANLYDDKTTQTFQRKFVIAFRQDKNWPKKLIKEIDLYAKESALLVKYLQKDWKIATQSEKLSAFKKYVNLLKNIQKFYVVAVPLTNFCERELQTRNPVLLSFSYPYKTLDVDLLNKSLRRIKLSPKNKQPQLIRRHLSEFAWIKTAYNIIENYTEKDVREELKHLSQENKSNKKSINNYLLTGLQIGIYLRNRMKELSQQLWFNVEPLVRQLAKDLNISRNDFFQMRYEEIVESLSKGKSVIPASIIKNRNRGYVYGYLDNQEILLTGSIVAKLYSQLEKKQNQNLKEIRGQVACSGLVKGRVKIILRHSEFSKLKKGEILVTNMTTPDFVVVMKKAGAIVTNEGGLSCHAAIVSRELGIPCVIGTKIATQVLKDGDLVEVDANKGIVRKV